MTRALVHAHTTWSHDGDLPLDAYVPIARASGCSAVLLTEHEESGWDAIRYAAYVDACRARSTNDVRLLPGLEFLQDGCHVLCYGLQSLPPRPSTIEALASAVHAQGCVLVLAHPAKYRWRIPAALLAGVDAVEVWNSKWIYDGACGPHPDTLRLAAGTRLMVGQDVHKTKHLSPLHVVTPTEDVLADIAQGQYAFAWGHRQWSVEEMRLPARASSARRHRVGMDLVLRAHRAAGRLLDGKRAPSAPRATRVPSRERTPSVTVILPIRNEHGFIHRTLASVLMQDYPANRLDILVADGQSTDGTRDVVQQFVAETDGRVRLIDNPGRIVPTGLNAALALATGDVIVRVDGHCEIPKDFVRRSIDHLVLDDVDCVGGILDTVGETPIARVIAAAMSARFGVGGSAFRSGSPVSGITDTVAFPAFTRRAIERVGLFDEELVRNQDDEYSARLRRAGCRILLATDVSARYYSRATFGSLFRQCFGYGVYKVRVLQKHPRQMRPRHFVPAAFVGVLTAAAMLAPVLPAAATAALAIGSVYLIAAGAAAFAVARLRGWRLLPWLPLAFGTMHIAYGAGFVAGAFKFWRHWTRVGRPPVAVAWHRPGGLT